MLIPLILIAIAFYDYFTQRIPNLYLVILFLCLIVQGLKIPSFVFLLVSVTSILFLTKISGCGFGDTKLALIVVNFLIPTLEILRYLEFLALISTVLVMVHLIRSRSLRGNIAFGPALCGAVLPFLS